MHTHLKTPPLHRSAFTLIELLIVISLIVVIAGIGFLAVPLFTSQQRASSNASIMVAWLGDAKVQALKDQRPTGMRLVPDATNPSFVREMYYVQTPDDFTGSMGDPTTGVLVNVTPYPNATNPDPRQPSLLTFSSDVDFTGGLPLTNPIDWPVQPGDFLEINGGGFLYQVVTVVPPSSFTVSRVATVTQQTSVWRIIRQPRRLTGVDSLTLNGNAVIDLTNSKNPPSRTASGQTYYEILFAPNGGVVGRGTSNSNSIILWVRDSTQALPTDNEPVLISIQVRTGFIGTYQVDTTSNDPYSFTRDPRASGM